ncbi:putative acetyltransferase [Janibacter sp. HTCC2649]|uniref:GNAT family N-acetyltransferase n=1 Tax=Janibacter sp. HTCC2649 TaxID=313589 RepID=UPI000066ED74|nr:GNAT family N-acetyltransferase [Janibacter sp. HTCC2649]EAP99336.1 putative acetyltransferase [Janibacter sp. HTCC2649]
MSDFALRQAAASDASWVAELRAEVMRPDLERLGRYDPVRVRQRFLTGFRPQVAHVIAVANAEVGLIAVRPEADETWIEHFYLRPDHQGRGLGEQVLRWALEQESEGRPFRLNVLQGSPARRLYERHGFVLEREDPIDVWMVRRAARG